MSQGGRIASRTKAGGRLLSTAVALLVTLAMAGCHGEHWAEDEGRREHIAEGQARGDHGAEGGEESGQRLSLAERWDAVDNGARLILSYNPPTTSFIGTVENTTQQTLCAVRVEVHLSNGTELGPTARTDLEHGQKMGVELSAAGEVFDWWTTHPETSSCSGGEGSGEHGAGGEAHVQREREESRKN